MVADAMDRTRSRKGGVAVGLLIVGLFCLAVWRVLSGSEHQAFAKGATPPASSAVTEGHTYSLAVPGGVPAMLSHGIAKLNSQLALSCDWSIGTGSPQSLPVSAEAVGTKAETKVAQFVAPVTGKIHVACDGWGAMFVPDADTGSSDPSGYFLLLSIITLTVGGVLALSVGYEVSVLRAARREEYAGDTDYEGRTEHPTETSVGDR
jgi:hypothetical protein